MGLAWMGVLVGGISLARPECWWDLALQSLLGAWDSTRPCRVFEEGMAITVVAQKPRLVMSPGSECQSVLRTVVQWRR